MRKILYSPGFGAGWVSWHSGSREEKLFMLEYKPFIDALEANKDLCGYFGRRDRKLVKTTFESDIPDFLPIDQFIKDWIEKFESEVPYLGGLRDLEIEEVSDGALVEIEDYDGNEKVKVIYGNFL